MVVEVEFEKLSENESERACRLGVPVGYAVEGEREAKERLMRVCEAKFVFRELVAEVVNGAIVAGGVSISSVPFVKSVAGMGRVCVVIATLGYATERELCRASMESTRTHFLLDAVSDVYVEALCDFAEEYIAKGRKHSARYSPGYMGLSLDLQKDLIKLTDAERLIGIKLTESKLMTPRKSVSFVFGIEE